MSDQKTRRVTLIPGDGIGPEVTQAVVRIIEDTGVKFEWERFAAGASDPIWIGPRARWPLEDLSRSDGDQTQKAG